MHPKWPTKAQHGRGYRSVPKMLRDMRDAVPLTQRELGDKIGRPHSWVYKCESGIRRVDIGEFFDWCRACGVDPVAAFKQYAARR